MSIRSFAMTYPQLMNQAMAQGLSKGDIQRLRTAYDVAEEWFNSFYRGQGVPFICHVVRTASIVLSERQPVEVVMAAMLHAVYMRGLFSGYHRNQPVEKLRSEIRKAVGEEVEALIWAYETFPWYSQPALDCHLKEMETYDPMKRRVLVMRVANELEDYLDLGMVYRKGDGFRKRIELYRGRFTEIARRLGLSRIAEELNEAYETHLVACLPEETTREHANAYWRQDRTNRFKALFEKAVSLVKR